MSDSDPKVKVTDKRMFTPDGELREDFRHLEESRIPSSPDPPTRERETEASASPSPSPQPPLSARPPVTSGAGGDAPVEMAADEGSRVASPSGGRLPEHPGFLDLLGALAEPIALFLGDARLPDGRSAEDLEAARFHIDLLEVVQQKSAGNLSAEESALLEDLLYRLRLRYVQKTG